MRRIAPLVLTLLAAPAAAQELVDTAPAAPLAERWAPDARLSFPLPELDAGSASIPVRVPVTARSRSVARGVLPGVIGAVLGGWVGYVASQVTRSDWDKEHNGEFNNYRLGYAAGGAVVGAITGVLIGRGAGAASSPSAPRATRRSSQEVITQEEIEASHARTGLELIQALRPRWLNVRGTNRFGETAQGQAGTDGIAVTPGESPIKVYINNSLLGDVSALRSLSLTGFTEVRFYNSAQATYRWGQGHLDGAIEFVGAAGVP